VIWFPNYATNGAYNADYETGNLFYFNTANSSTAPTNTIASPYGSATGGTTSGVTSGGATQFLASATVSDFREISSCMNLVYTGTRLDEKGIVTPISNLSPDAILSGGTAGAPASVDQLIAMMQQTTRVGLDQHSVRSRPNPAMLENFQQELSTPILVGQPTLRVSAIPSNVIGLGPSCMGFAWTGIAANQLHFTFTQNIEWRPDVAAGFKVSIPKQLSNVSTIANIVKKLDAHVPGWTTMAQRYIAKVIQSSITGYASSNRRLLR
jgi:hypothetical protein